MVCTYTTPPTHYTPTHTEVHLSVFLSVSGGSATGDQLPRMLPYREGSVVGVRVDFEERTLKFYVDGEYVNKAIPIPEDVHQLWPTITCYHRRDSFKITPRPSNYYL